MGQKAEVISITSAMKAEQERRAQEPDACAAMERSFPGFSTRDIIPTRGNGPGFTRACDRTDCEWLEGTVCARWLRLAKQAALNTPRIGAPTPGAIRPASSGVEIFMSGAWHRVEPTPPLRPVETMAYDLAVEAARRVRDIPPAAQAIMDRWLDAAKPDVESLVRAGYDRPDHREAAEYMGLVAVGLQHPHEVAATLGLPWSCP